MTRQSLLLGAAIAVLSAAIGCSSDPDDLTPAAGAAPAAASAPAVTPAMLEKGRTLYKSNCTACHGETGKGDGPAAVSFKPAPRDHTDRGYMDKLTDKNIADVIQMGGAAKGMPLMPSSPQIRGADLDALIAYVRSLSRK
jgi:mono/diheme cytochrome c family protein